MMKFLSGKPSDAQATGAAKRMGESRRRSTDNDMVKKWSENPTLTVLYRISVFAFTSIVVPILLFSGSRVLAQMDAMAAAINDTAKILAVTGNKVENLEDQVKVNSRRIESIEGRRSAERSYP